VCTVQGDRQGLRGSGAAPEAAGGGFQAARLVQPLCNGTAESDSADFCAAKKDCAKPSMIPRTNLTL
jgi:hypothetical protein